MGIFKVSCKFFSVASAHPCGSECRRGMGLLRRLQWCQMGISWSVKVTFSPTICVWDGDFFVYLDDNGSRMRAARWSTSKSALSHENRSQKRILCTFLARRYSECWLGHFVLGFFAQSRNSAPALFGLDFAKFPECLDKLQNPASAPDHVFLKLSLFCRFIAWLVSNLIRTKSFFASFIPEITVLFLPITNKIIGHYRSMFCCHTNSLWKFSWVF